MSRPGDTRGAQRWMRDQGFGGAAPSTKPSRPHCGRLPMPQLIGLPMMMPAGSPAAPSRGRPLFRYQPDVHEQPSRGGRTIRMRAGGIARYLGFTVVFCCEETADQGWSAAARGSIRRI